MAKLITPSVSQLADSSPSDDGDSSLRCEAVLNFGDSLVIRIWEKLGAWGLGLKASS